MGLWGIFRNTDSSSYLQAYPGNPGTGICAGIIGAIGAGRNETTPTEEGVLRALLRGLNHGRE
jgi:predicted metal-dependent phosphotriesterase family hydrolase